MIVADRQQFMDCLEGNLMIRNRAGVITHLGAGAVEAVEAAERGERVLLTRHGVIVSEVVDGIEVPVNYGKH